MLLNSYLDVQQTHLNSGLYYKHVTIVSDDSSISNKWSLKFIDDARVVIYDRNRFIIQAFGRWSYVEVAYTWKDPSTHQAHDPNMVRLEKNSLKQQFYIL